MTCGLDPPHRAHRSSLIASIYSVYPSPKAGHDAPTPLRTRRPAIPGGRPGGAADDKVAGRAGRDAGGLVDAAERGAAFGGGDGAPLATLARHDPLERRIRAQLPRPGTAQPRRLLRL